MNIARRLIRNFRASVSTSRDIDLEGGKRAAKHSRENYGQDGRTRRSSERLAAVALRRIMRRRNTQERLEPRDYTAPTTLFTERRDTPGAKTATRDRFVATKHSRLSPSITVRRQKSVLHYS